MSFITLFRTVLVGLLVLVLPICGAFSLVRSARETSWFSDHALMQISQVAPPTFADADRLLGYSLSGVMAGGPVPRSYFATVPLRLRNTADTALRKDLFIRTLLPLVLCVNDQITRDRERLIRFQNMLHRGVSLNDMQRRWISEQALPLKLTIEEPTMPEDLDPLIQALDIIPPSLAIAQAAIETGWGSSRFAHEGRALYGQWIWGDGVGIVPARRPEGLTHKIRSFDTLMQSVSAYIRNLNRHEAYAGMRRGRAEMRQMGVVPDGARLANFMIDYSTRREEYVEDLQRLIRVNRLGQLDGLTLASERS